MTTRRIIGADEVGTGCIAGPLVVCAVCVPVAWNPPPGLRDSKKLSEHQRETLEAALRHVGAMPNLMVDISLGLRSAEDIDLLGLRVVLINAFRQVITNLKRRHGTSLDDVIVDGDMHLSFARSLVKADDTIPAVSAASVLAKTYRDQIMRLYETEYPGYGFAKHKGYPTKEHLAALKLYGPSPIHRKTFAPVAALLEKS